MNEARDKRERFIELAQTRTIKAIAAIELLGNFANPGNRMNYEFGDKDIDKIFDALEQAVERTKQKMSAVPKKTQAAFTL